MPVHGKGWDAAERAAREALSLALKAGWRGELHLTASLVTRSRRPARLSNRAFSGEDV